MKVYLFLALVLVSFGFVGNVLADDISTCQALSANTEYKLTSNVTAAEDSHCFTTFGDNITLDCDGYTIFGNTSSSSKWGVYNNKKEIKIYNCFFENWTNSYAMYVSGGNAIYENITVRSDSGKISIYNNGNNSIFNNLVFEGTTYLYLYGTSSNNTINNLIGGIYAKDNADNITINHWVLTGTTYASLIQTTDITINRLHRYNTGIQLYLRANNLILSNSIIEDNTAQVDLGDDKHDIRIVNLTFRNNTDIASSLVGDGIINLTIRDSEFHNSSHIRLIKSAGTQNTTNLVFKNNIINDTALVFQSVVNGSIFNNSFIGNISDPNVYLLHVDVGNDVYVYNNTASVNIPTHVFKLQEINQFKIYNNFVSNAKYGIYVRNCSNGLVFDNNVSNTERGSHGILIHEYSNNITACDNYVNNYTYGLLIETTSYLNKLYDNTIQDCSIGIYDLHDTFNNTICSNYIGGNLILHDNVTNELFYNNVVTGDLIFRAGFEPGEETGAFNNTIKNTHIQGNLEVKKSTDNILLNVTWNGTETVDANNVSSYIRKWYFGASANLENVSISWTNVFGSLLGSSLTNSSLVIPRQELIDYINNGGIKTYHSNYEITASKPGYDSQSQNVNMSTNRNIIFSLSPTTTTPSGGGGYPIYKPTQEQLQSEKGYEKSLRKNWKITFAFNNRSHTVKLDDIVNKTAVITVSSESVTFNLALNETKKLNLDDDIYYDLQVSLKDISDYDADLVVKLISEEISKCQADWHCSKWGECVNYTEMRTCTDLNNCNTTEDKPDEVRDCCEPDWECTEWSECINEQQTRTCRDLNNCSVAEGKPAEVKSCDVKGKLRPMAIANESIFLTKEKIQEALGKGLDVNLSQSLLEQALSYFEAGNYPKADESAKQAYDIAEQLLSQYKPPDWKTKEIEWAYYVPVLIILVIVVVCIVLTRWKKNVISSFRKRLRSREYFKIILAWNSVAWEAIASAKVGWDLVHCGR